MPSEKISLKNSLVDSPQIQAQVAKLEGSIAPMKDCTILLRDTFQACSVHQQKVCEGTDALSKLLSSFQEDSFSEDDSFLSGSFGRLGRYLSELHSCQDMLSTQLQNAVIELLSQFISKDFTELDKLKENYDAAWQEHEQATVKFSRVSKKKDSEKTRFEANSDLFAARKKYYETCLEYFSKLNGFKLKWKYSLLEPLLTYMHAQMAYFKVGHEVLNKELGKVLNELNTEVQRIHAQYQQDAQSMTDEKEEIELSFPTLCLPDPDPTDPFVDYQPPKTTIANKSGYLFLRIQKTGFLSQWERGYFFTKKGYLYSHFPQKSPEIFVHMKAADASAGDMDDRRYVFQVMHSTQKKPVYLLAESEIERDEWIATINNSGMERSMNQPNTTGASKDAEVIKLERERIRSWVKKEIHDPPKRDRSNTKVPRAGTTSASNLSLPIISKPSSTAPTQTTKGRSPILSRKTTKQKKSDSTLPQVPPLTQSSPLSPPSSISQLPSPLQPERVQAANSKFSVKYLGHTEIKDGKGANVITETIRKVMAARSVQNVKSALDIEMTVAQRSIVFMDLSAKKAIGQIQMKGVLRCSTHPDNRKLLGIVNRSFSETDKPRYICHVLESDFEGSKICKVIVDSVQAVMKGGTDQQGAPAKLHKRSSSAVSKSNGTSVQHTKDFADLSKASQNSVQPKQQSQLFSPPPSFQYLTLDKDVSSGYVTIDSQGVVKSSKLAVTSAPQKSASDTNLPSLREQSSATQSRQLPPGASSASSSSSRSSSIDFLSMDALQTDQGSVKQQYPPTDSTFTDGVDDFSAEMDDLPPLDSPDLSQSGLSSRQTDNSYISDSDFGMPSIGSPDVVTPKVTEDTTSVSEYFPMPQVFPGSQTVNNAASANQLYENEGPWSSTSSSSGYYKTGDNSTTPATTSQQTLTDDDFDLLDTSFSAFNSANTSITSTDPFSAGQDTVQSSTVSSNSGYYTSQGGSVAQKPTSLSSIGSTTHSLSTPMSYPSSTAAPGSNTQTCSELDEEFDLGDPVDLLSDLSEPLYADNAGFETNFSSQGSSSGPGFYQQTAPSSSMSSNPLPTSGSGYYSTSGSSMFGGLPNPLPPSQTNNTVSGYDDDDDQGWLPPLPDDL